MCELFKRSCTVYKMTKILKFTYFIFSHIDANKEKYIETLREAVAIQSVSAWPEKRGEIVKMAHWVKDKLEKLGTQVELCELGTQVSNDLLS